MPCTYDDMQRLGRRCDICPLRKEGAGPVPAEILPGTHLAAVSQEPGKTEVKSGRILSGPSGQYFDKMLASIGRSRQEVSCFNTVCCMPPGGDIRAYEARLAIRNKKRVAAGEAPLPTPTSCCLPGLHRELATFKYVIPMGAVAAHALVPHMRGGIQGMRGTMREIPANMMSLDSDPKIVPGRRMVPVLNPAHVLREPVWEEVFRIDLDRMFRWMEGRVGWKDPEMLFRPDPDTLANILWDDSTNWRWRGTRATVFDVETDHIRAMQANLRCVGIGTPDWGVIVPFEPVQWAKVRRAQRSGKKVPDADLAYTGHSGSIPLYDIHERKAIAEILRRWAVDPNIVKLGWNSGSYDRLVMEQQLGVTPTPMLDGILLARSAFPNLPKGLGFIGSVLTDVRAWKQDHTSTQTKNDEELYRYCLLDVAVTAKVMEPLMLRAEARGQSHLLGIDHGLQNACVGMHRLGVLVDQEERWRQHLVHAAPGPCTFEERYFEGSQVKTRTVHVKEGEIQKWITRARLILQKADVDVSAIVKRTKKLDEQNLELRAEMAAHEDGLSVEEQEDGWSLPSPADLSLDTLAFNPMSSHQLRAVLFDVWDLPIPTSMQEKELYTSSGEISTGDAILRRLTMDGRLTPEQRAFVHAIRMSRRYAKTWSTYLRPARLPTGRDADDTGCIVWPDGRVHPVWNSHSVVTGRLASSDPNGQNISAAVKKIYVGAPGHSLVGIDLDQLEFRVAASRWQIAMYLEAFERGLDPYQFTMLTIFGKERFWAFAGGPSVFGKKDFAPKSSFDAMRKLAKQCSLAFQYGASLETGYRLITSAEDRKTGKLEYAHLEMKEVAGMYKNWLSGAPEYEKGWEQEIAFVNQHGYNYESISGRRRYFPGGVTGANRNECINVSIQSAAASAMNIMLLELLERVPFNKWGPDTGIINQVHDAITIECPDSEVEWTKQTMLDVMHNRKFNGLPGVTLTADPQIAWRHKDAYGHSRYSST